MFEKVISFFKNLKKVEDKTIKSKDTARERLHLVLMQDRANVSADFLELMKQEIIDVIKKYIDIDENAIDVRLTNKTNEDGTNGAPALYANIPITNIKQKLEVGSQMSDVGVNAHIEQEGEQASESKEEVISAESQIQEIKQEENSINTEVDEHVIEEIKEAEEIKEKVETELREQEEVGEDKEA